MGRLLHGSGYLEIGLLGDRGDCLPRLAQWFRREWPAYYAGRTNAEVEGDFRRELNAGALPMRLFAFVGGELVGTVVLRVRAIGSRADYAPGLGGLYVAEGWRRRGVGTELVRAGMAAAGRDLGCAVLYTATATTGGIFERLGWRRVDTVVEGGTAYGVFECRLDGAVNGG